MSEDELVAFDLETGGTEPGHPDIQLAAIAFRVGGNWASTETFEAKIRFDEADADPKALEINSYDPEVWAREAKPETAVVDEFAAFLGRHATMAKRGVKPPHRPYRVARIVGHHAVRFDGPRLLAMFRRHDRFLPADAYRPLDSLQRALWYCVENGLGPADYKLPTLVEFFGLPVVQFHDAASDARAVWMLAAFFGGWRSGS